MAKYTEENNTPWFLVIVLGLIVIGMCGGACWLAWQRWEEDMASDRPVEMAEAAMIDRAIAVKGAITIGTHRDLNELGIVDASFKFTLTSPAIAVKNGEKWCVWELGYEGAVWEEKKDDRGIVDYKNSTIIGSGGGYKEAYGDFMECAKPVTSACGH